MSRTVHYYDGNGSLRSLEVENLDDVICGALLGTALGALWFPVLAVFALFGFYVRAVVNSFNRPAWDSLSDLKRC